MADTLALIALYDAVVARFVLEGTAATNHFGWRASAQQLPGQRIVWIPGDEDGDIGEMLAPRHPGGNPRSLGTLDEIFRVEIKGEDTTAPESERAQYIAARFLFDTWYRAIYLAAHGTFAIKTANWIVDKKERRHGASINVVCAIQAMIPDSEQGVAPADTRAVIDVTQLDVTEQFETAPAP
jgi:hypothetical protein